MTYSKLLSLVILVSLFAFVGCDDSSNSSSTSGNDPYQSQRLNWAAIPNEYNPRIEEVTINTFNIERVKMDIFSFKGDVEVAYSDSLENGRGILRMFTVYKDFASFGSLQPRNNGTNLELTKYGQYQCQIKISNGEITALKGGCYIRLQLILPTGSQVEVYNVGTLISQRFIPIDTTTFLKNFDDASWSEQKFAAINDYLNSYTGLSRRPALTTKQLIIVIDDFMRGEEKLEALRRLQSIIVDREKLGEMIESRFSYFDRPEARRIVGL